MHDLTRVPAADTVIPLPGTRGQRPAVERDIGLLLSVEEAAQRLHIGRSTIYALVASQQIESVTIGKLRRIPADALDAYIAALRRATPHGA